MAKNSYIDKSSDADGLPDFIIMCSPFAACDPVSLHSLFVHKVHSTLHAPDYSGVVYM